MPFLRVSITCGLCGQGSPIILGNPQLATTKENSPIIQHHNGVVFECSHCKARIALPVRTSEPTHENV